MIFLGNKEERMRNSRAIKALGNAMNRCVTHSVKIVPGAIVESMSDKDREDLKKLKIKRY